MSIVSLLGQDNLYGSYDFQFSGAYTSLPALLVFLGATYTRNSTKHVLQDGQLVALSANQFGTSYDPVTGLYGYLPETAATNLCPSSENYTAPGWGGTMSIISSNNLAPDGTNTASLLQCNDTTSFRVYNLGTLGAGTYVSSEFVKKGNTRYVMAAVNINGDHGYIFDLDNNCAVTGTIGSPGGYLVIPMSNGWYRISVWKTSAVSAMAHAGAIYTSTSPTLLIRAIGDNIYRWGVQVETGQYASSYIKTTGATAARAADVLTVPLANVAGFNSAGYTLFVDCRCDIAAERSALAISAGSQNYAQLLADSSGLWRFDVKSGNVNQAYVAYDTHSSSRQKIASVVADNNFIGAQNGVAKTSDLSGVVPVSPTILRIGDDYGGGKKFNGYIFNAKLITRALSQSQINGLTT